MTLKIEKSGRRWHVTGTDTFVLRDKIRSTGCHWDPQTRVWWTGSAKVAAAIERTIPRWLGVAATIPRDPRPTEAETDPHLRVVSLPDGMWAVVGPALGAAWDDLHLLGCRADYSSTSPRMLTLDGSVAQEARRRIAGWVQRHARELERLEAERSRTCSCGAAKSPEYPRCRDCWADEQLSRHGRVVR